MFVVQKIYYKYNRFSLQQSDFWGTINNKYLHFIKSNKETATKLIPMKGRRENMKQKDDERMKQAKSDIQAAYLTYKQNSNE